MTAINSMEALDRFDNDTEMYIDLVDTFFSIVDADMRDFSKSLKEGNKEQILYLAHKMKGAALTLGAQDLSTISCTVEGMLRADIGANVQTEVAELLALCKETIEALTRLRDELQKQP